MTGAHSAAIKLMSALSVEPQQVRVRTWAAAGHASLAWCARCLRLPASRGSPCKLHQHAHKYWQAGNPDPFAPSTATAAPLCSTLPANRYCVSCRIGEGSGPLGHVCLAGGGTTCKVSPWLNPHEHRSLPLRDIPGSVGSGCEKFQERDWCNCGTQGQTDPPWIPGDG